MKILLKTLVVIVYFTMTTVQAISQKPDWADKSVRESQYNNNDFLAGFASEVNVQQEKPHDLLRRLENYAKTQLIEYVQVSVKSETELLTKQTDLDFSLSFQSTSSSGSQLDLVGLKIETTYDTRSKTGYALAYAKRDNIYEYYRNQIELILTEADSKLAVARSLLSENDNREALRIVNGVASLLANIEQAQKVLIALQARNAVEQDIQIVRKNQLNSDIEAIIRQAQRSEHNTLEDACLFLVRGLLEQTGKPETAVRIRYFTFQDSRMASPLARQIQLLLQSQLVKEASWQIVMEPHGNQRLPIISGTFWDAGNDLKIIANMIDNDGIIIAASEAFLPKKWLQNNRVEWLPANFEEAYSKLKVFETDEIISGDLNLEVWTNKGSGNLLFVKDEIMKVYIRANKECYIRMVYHLSDNQSVILLDNYYIPTHLAHRIVEIPEEFICSEPFGIETLQVNAQTEPFQPLNTRLIDGYNYITGALEDAVINTRGMKKSVVREPEKTEKRIVITTMDI